MLNYLIKFIVGVMICSVFFNQQKAYGDSKTFADVVTQFNSYRTQLQKLLMKVKETGDYRLAETIETEISSTQVFNKNLVLKSEQDMVYYVEYLKENFDRIKKNLGSVGIRKMGKAYTDSVAILEKLKPSVRAYFAPMSKFNFVRPFKGVVARAKNVVKSGGKLLKPRNVVAVFGVVGVKMLIGNQRTVTNIPTRYSPNQPEVFGAQ